MKLLKPDVILYQLDTDLETCAQLVVESIRARILEDNKRWEANQYERQKKNEEIFGTQMMSEAFSDYYENLVCAAFGIKKGWF